MAPRRIVSPEQDKPDDEPAQEVEQKEFKQIKEVTTEEIVAVFRAHDQRISNLEATNQRVRGAF